MTVEIAYLGPVGTFSEEAALRFAGTLSGEAKLLPCPTIEDCAETVEDGTASFAVVPLENSLEGSVNITLDLLTTSAELRICAELVLAIEQNLLVADGGLGEIKQVYSHPQAMAQCRNFLRRSLPAAEKVPVVSTSEAASTAAKLGVGAAAIGSRRAAELYGLKICAAAVQDNGNQTRFVILGRQGSLAGTPEKTSLLFAVKDGPGSLFRVLQSFAVHGVNLTKIESRPAKRQLGDYLFFVDLAGTPENQTIMAALREASREAVMLKLLGTYAVMKDV
ncbi:MAG: prephenate dehydratase [Dethiobacter sp.]|jgi:prephenate dehydratase|nr:prephenate dehydratase [Dethiobacter sp.]